MYIYVKLWYNSVIWNMKNWCRAVILTDRWLQGGQYACLKCWKLMYGFFNSNIQVDMLVLMGKKAVMWYYHLSNGHILVLASSSCWIICFNPHQAVFSTDASPDPNPLDKINLHFHLKGKRSRSKSSLRSPHTPSQSLICAF